MEIKLHPRPGRQPGIVRATQGHDGGRAEAHHPRPPGAAGAALVVHQGSVHSVNNCGSSLLHKLCPETHFLRHTHIEERCGLLRKMWFVETAWCLEDDAVCLLSL